MIGAMWVSLTCAKENNFGRAREVLHKENNIKDINLVLLLILKYKITFSLGS